MEKKDTITEKELRFIRYYEYMQRQGKEWTYGHAAKYLGYSSKNSIQFIVNSLKKKGYVFPKK